MNPTKKALERAIAELPDGPEKVVCLTMLANLECGASNRPLMDKAAEIAQQILTDITA